MKYTTRSLFLFPVCMLSLVLASPENSPKKSWWATHPYATLAGAALLTSTTAFVGYKLYYVFKNTIEKNKKNDGLSQKEWKKARVFTHPVDPQKFTLKAAPLTSTQEGDEKRHHLFSFKNNQTGIYGSCLYESYRGNHTATLLAHKDKGLASLFLDERTTHDAPTALTRAFALFNEQLKAANETSGAMALMAVIEGENLYIANLGTSQAFLVRDKRIHSRTIPHPSLIDLTDQGIPYGLGSFTHRKKPAIAIPEITEIKNIQKNDFIILVSGSVVHEYKDLGSFEEGRFLQSLLTAHSLQEAASNLISRESGFKGNDAVVVIQVQ